MLFRLVWLVALTVSSVALAEEPAPGPRASHRTGFAYDTYAASTPSAQFEVKAAQQLFSQGDYKRAARTLEIVLREEPGNSGLLDELGIIYERLAETSAFPSISQGRAEKFFRRSIAADGNDPRPIEHLISLLLDPPNQCRGDLTEVKSLIRQLSAINSGAAQEASQNLEWTTHEQITLSERSACAPHTAMTFLKRALP
jgi:Flp pilus assembly protein TadD